MEIKLKKEKMSISRRKFLQGSAVATATLEVSSADTGEFLDLMKIWLGKKYSRVWYIGTKQRFIYNGL